MKTSSKLLLIVLIVFAVIMVGSIVGLRFYVDRLETKADARLSNRCCIQEKLDFSHALYDTLPRKVIWIEK